MTGLAKAAGLFVRAGQANQTVRNMLAEEEIYSGPAGLTAPGRNIHNLRKNIQTGCEPDTEQRGISTVLLQPARTGGSAGGYAIPLPTMLTGQHEDMEQTMTPDVIADDGDVIARQQQPAEGGRAEYFQEYNVRRREKRAVDRADRIAQQQLLCMAGHCANCTNRRGCTCNECDRGPSKEREAQS